MTRAEALDRGRESFRKQSWSSAFTQLSAADRDAQLDPDDLQWLAITANLIGREDVGTEVLVRAHHGFLSGGDTRGAARCAFWLAFGLLNNGDLAQGGGWLARAHRLLADAQHDCVEQGYLLVPEGIRSVHEGNAAAAHDAFLQAAAIGERFGDRDLVTIALMGQGRALIRQGETARGVSLLDESMIAVTAGEVSPLVAGGVYCSVIEACGEIFDLSRAHEWTSALERWCDSQPDVVPFRGHCLVRRAEILQLRGSWLDALEQARQACAKLSVPTPKPAIGAALYRMAEIHRLRGEFDEAENYYRQANRWERTPQPGVARLLLAQGQREGAWVAIRNVANAVKEPGVRVYVLDSYVEIALAAGDVPTARAAAEELAQITGRFNSLLLKAVAAMANGSVQLAEEDADGALAALRQAFAIWREIDAPYETARAQMLVGLACRQLGDHATAVMELSAARDAFRTLGAAPDLARVEALLRNPESKSASPLTDREVQVLRLVSSGSTNHDIARKLGISEKTVARHLSNIFTKLDLPSRAAATAYAYQNGLISSAST